MNRTQYNEARALLRENGRMALRWLRPDVRNAMELVLERQYQKDDLLEREDMVLYCRAHGIACTLRQTTSRRLLARFEEHKALGTYEGWRNKARELLAGKPDWTALVDESADGYVVALDGDVYAVPKALDPSYEYSLDDLIDFDRSAWNDEIGAWDCMDPADCRAVLQKPTFTSLRHSATESV